jgi:hypothetical protein
MAKCRWCFDEDPKICEAKNRKVPAEVIHDYEACECNCHDDESGDRPYNPWDNGDAA